MLAYKDGERVRLVSRNGRDHRRRFADLTAAVAKLSARTLVLDEELLRPDHVAKSGTVTFALSDAASSGRRTVFLRPLSTSFAACIAFNASSFSPRAWASRARATCVVQICVGC